MWVKELLVETEAEGLEELEDRLTVVAQNVAIRSPHVASSELASYL